jgi:TolA-binding protein
MVSEEIGTGDHVRILDFGLARLRGAVGRDATQSNVVVGTPNYMAPEQTVGGGLIDARTDIYAAGVVLFEMVSGERPFQAEDTLALLGMHRAAPIPQLADWLPEGTPLPAGLQELIDQAMAKTPGDRFQSAIELAEAIDAVAGGTGGAEGGARAIQISEARRVVGSAPTVLDLDAAEPIAPASRRRPRPRGGFFGSLILLAILVGGVGAAVLWIKARSASKVATAQATAASVSDDQSAAGARVGSAGSGSAAGGSAAGGSAAGGSAGSVAAAPGVPGVGPPSASTIGPGRSAGGQGPGTAGAPEAAGSAAEAAGSAVPAAVAGGAASGADPSPGAPPAAGSAAPAGEGSGDRAEPAAVVPSADIEMDPTTADDPAPVSTRPASGAEEAANAPRTPEEAERAERHQRDKRPPAAPALATTIEAAVRLIQDGKHDLAMASLQDLGKKIPASAYIPFLLGNLYYDQRWWTVAMDHYALAIKKNAQYRSNPTLNRNVISMLASDKTSHKAQGFLKFTVGRPSVPYLKHAAQHDASAQVRRTSGRLLRNL